MKRNLMHIFKVLLASYMVCYLVFAPRPAQASIWDSITDIYDSIAEKASMAYDAVVDFANDVYDSAVETLHEAQEAIDTAMEAATEFATEVVQEAAAAVLGIDLTDNCVPPSKSNDASSCLFCPMFKVIFNAGSAIAAKSYATFHSDLGILVLLFLAVSLALIILRNIATMGAKEPGSLLNEIFQKTFIGVVVYLIITRDYYHILNLTITPIFQDGLNFVLGSSGTCHNAGGIDGYSGKMGAGTGGGLPLAVGTSIVCAVEEIEQKIGLLFKYGDWAFCRAFGPDRILLIIPNFIYMIDALFLYIGGILFMVTYPWVMGDAVLQLGIAVAIIPFALCGYPFSGTKDYLGKMLSWILNSLFVFMFVAILLNVILGQIVNILDTSLTNAAGNAKRFFYHPVDGIAFYGINMLKILFFLFIGWTYIPNIKDLAGEFSKGSALSASGKVGSAIYNKADSAMKKVADKGGDMAISAGKSALKTSDRLVRSGMRRGAIVGVNMVGGKVKLPGFEMSTQKVGNKTILRREFKSITGRKHVMLSDKYTTIKQEYTASGKLIKSDVKFKRDFIKKYLLDAKTGYLNQDAFQALLDSPMGKQYHKEIMEGVTIELLRQKGIKVGTYYSQKGVIFDPSNPSKITIEQNDFLGHKSKMEMEIAASGQVAVKAFIQGDHDYQKFMDNGAVKVSHVGKKAKGDLNDGDLISIEDHVLSRRHRIGRKISRGLKMAAVARLGSSHGSSQSLSLFGYHWIVDTDSATGNSMLTTRHKNLFTHRTTVTYSDEYMTQKEVYTKSGKLVSHKEGFTEGVLDKKTKKLDPAKLRKLETGYIGTSNSALFDKIIHANKANWNETTTIDYREDIKYEYDVLGTGHGKPPLVSGGAIDPKIAGEITFGMDDFFGQKMMGTKSMQDFLVKDILETGQKKGTNKLHTQTDSTRNFYYIARDNGEVFAAYDTTTNVITPVGGGRHGIANISGGIAFDGMGNVIGRVL